MAGGWMREPQGRVTLTPMGLSAAMREERGIKPKPMSKRAITAQLKAQRREDAVIVRQRPVLTPRQYESYLRTGSL